MIKCKDDANKFSMFKLPMVSTATELVSNDRFH